MKILSLVVSLWVCFFMFPSYTKGGDLGENVSLINLIATPEKYDKKVVFITAFVTIGLENMSLCPSREVLTHKDCLWLDIESDLGDSNDSRKVFKDRLDKWKKFDKKVVSIRGTFDKNIKGHFRGWSGGIKEVTQVLEKAE